MALQRRKYRYVLFMQLYALVLCLGLRETKPALERIGFHDRHIR